MSKQTIWAIVGVVVVVVGIAAFFYLRERSNEINDEVQNLQTLEDLNQILDGNTGSSVSLPSTNPLDEVAPGVNPITETNPFSDVYANPFE